MGQKDKSEKLLMDWEDIFADIVNVLLFQGEQRIQPDELKNTPAKSIYKADDGKLHEMERDVSKYWAKENVRIAMFGLENQTKPEENFPLRVIGYDGASYRSQLLSIADADDESVNVNGQQKKLCPVVTLVLYFGTEKHWDKQTTLTECFDVPERFKPYVNDYKINLFEIAYLPDETVALFQSDFGIVADFFVQMRKNKDYKAPKQKVRHVDEVLKLMKVLTGNNRFEKVPKNVRKKEGVTMYDVFERAENRGLEKGRAEGLEDMVYVLRNMNISADESYKQIVQLPAYSKVTPEQIKKLYGKKRR